MGRELLANTAEASTTQNSTAMARGLTSCGLYRLPGFKRLRAESLGGSYDCVQSSFQGALG